MEHTMTGLEKFSPTERNRIMRALKVATDAHGTQRRVSGEPYISHPIAVAELLISRFDADADTVIAGLLHDTAEDTKLTLDDVEREFGSEVRFLVDGATDVGRGDGRAVIDDRAERDAASHVKVDEYSVKDPRLPVIKIADRWHNMMHCAALRAKNQKRLARETLDFHVPWARKLGFLDQASELEAIAVKVFADAERLENDGASSRRYRS